MPFPFRTVEQLTIQGIEDIQELPYMPCMSSMVNRIKVKCIGKDIKMGQD